ncbi:MAG: hypothetical protein Kow00114_28910 [Kiloniellaceae bacterium]
MSQEDIDRAFAALDQIGKIDDDEIQNQLTVGVLEILADEPSSTQAAREKLTGRALELFEKMMKFWHGPKTGNA